MHRLISISWSSKSSYIWEKVPNFQNIKQDSHTGWILPLSSVRWRVVLNDSTAMFMNIYWNIVSSGGPIITQHHIMASPALRKIKTALNLSFPTLNALHGRKVRFFSICSYRIGQMRTLVVKNRCANSFTLPSYSAGQKFSTFNAMNFLWPPERGGLTLNIVEYADNI